MARNFESFIVDPSLLDPSIDTSNLRTTTDTREELLSDVPDYAGIQFDPTRTSYLDDLYALYSGQLPMTPTATTPAVGSPANGGGGGGGGTIGTGSGGQATGGGLTQSGTFGGQPTFTTTPGTTVDDITGDITNPDGTYGGNIVNEVALTGGTTAPQSGFLASGAAGGASLADLDLDNIDLGNPTGDSRVVSEEDGLSGKPGMLGDTGGSMDQMSGTMPSMLGDTGGSMDQMSGAQQESALSEAFRLGKEALDSGMQTISQVGQSIADSVKGTYDDLEGNVNVPGLGEISVRDTLAGLAINAAVGAPVSLVKYAMDQLPKSTSQLAYEGYTAEQQAAVDEIFGPNGSMVGYNAVSGFGTTPAETIRDRINNIKNRKAPQTTASEKKIEELEKDYEKITGEAIKDEKTVDEKIDEGIDAAEDDKELEDIGTEAITADDAFKETGDYDSPSVDTDPVGPQFEDQSYSDPGADAEENQPGTYDGYDDFDDGTMTGDAADSVDDVLGPISSPPTGTNKPGEDSKEDAGFSPGSQSNSPGNPANQNGGNENGGGGRGCVIATHAVNSGAFTKDTKREAVRWCVKNLHRTWWGEAVRKGYRYYGQKAIEQGNAKNHYQEFKDYVAFGTGKRRTLKTGWTFVYRTVQFFLRGLIL